MALLQLIMKLISLFRRKNLRLHQISLNILYVMIFGGGVFYSIYSIFAMQVLNIIIECMNQKDECMKKNAKQPTNDAITI